MWGRRVETFDVACNPNTTLLRFAYRDDETLQYATIAETNEVNSPKMAVKTFIASRMAATNLIRVSLRLEHCRFDSPESGFIVAWAHAAIHENVT